MRNDSFMTKIRVLIISLILTGICVGLYFIESLEWQPTKLISCILISSWVFFIAPTAKYLANWFNSISDEETLSSGFKIGYLGIWLLFLIAPLVGIYYFFNRRLEQENAVDTILVGFYLK